MVVMKFGGTSVADAEAIRRLVSLVGRQDKGCIVVVSALARVTDGLLQIAGLAGSGAADEASGAVDSMKARHLEVAAVVSDARRRSALAHELTDEFSTLQSVVSALGVLRDVTPRVLDAVAAVGELLSSRLVCAALQDAGLPAVWIDARRAIVTNGDHTRALPLMAETKERLRLELAGHLAGGHIPVLGGFVGATRDGATTTLGRGGSDYSAGIIGAALEADEIQIWTDVDGILTADPRVIPSARPVPRLSFDEASELAYFGAKVLHPSTVQPAIERNIPVRILNSRRPEAPGTLITVSSAPSDRQLMAIACKRDVTAIDITSTRMLMAYGFLARVFEVFARFQTAVDVVTTSEVSVSVTIDNRSEIDGILAALGEFADVSCQPDMALLCAVGQHLRTDPTLVARLVGTLEGIGLSMVSQAASRRNITFVLRQADLPAAMQRLHDRFFGDEAREPSAACE